MFTKEEIAAHLATQSPLWAQATPSQRAVLTEEAHVLLNYDELDWEDILDCHAQFSSPEEYIDESWELLNGTYYPRFASICGHEPQAVATLDGDHEGERLPEGIYYLRNGDLVRVVR